MDGSLQEILKKEWKGNRIPEKQATFLLYEIVQAYRYIYDKSEIKKSEFKEGGDIIHRDVKPENILFKRSEKALIFKIGDLGSIRNQKIMKTLTR